MNRGKVFEGIKVLDFTSAGVGPMTSRHLAFFGATVIRVESMARPCVTRTVGPFKDHFSHPDWTTYIEHYNSGKRAITLNMSNPKGIEIAWRLVDWCNVITESFTPGVMARWGLDYERVRKVKPDIVFMSINAQGQYGPHADWRGYGPLISTLAGHYHFTGWPDREPATIYGAYNDFIAPRFGGLALVAALAYRKRTGKGQYIDCSQYEHGVMFLAPMVMEYTVNGRVQMRNGNRLPDAAPHGAYPCRGQERWVAIAVTGDEEWEAFKKVIGEPDWTTDPRFATLMGRKANEDELDRLVGEWTASQVAEEVMERMQQAGVPAGVAWNAKDLLEDPQLRARGHYVVVDGHPNIGPMTLDGPQPHLSKTPPEMGRFYGPMGYDNAYVYREILGMSDDEIADCLVEEVFE